MKSSRILYMFVLLGLLLAPLRMFGGGEAAAMPHHGPAAMSHCDMDAPVGSEGQPATKASCMMACAAMPAIEAAVPERPARVAVLAQPRLAPNLHGLSPEAATPPPRRA